MGISQEKLGFPASGKNLLHISQSDFGSPKIAELGSSFSGYLTFLFRFCMTWREEDEKHSSGHFHFLFPGNPTPLSSSYVARRKEDPSLFLLAVQLGVRKKGSLFPGSPPFFFLVIPAI